MQRLQNDVSTLGLSKKNIEVFTVHTTLMLFPQKMFVTAKLAWHFTAVTGTQNYDSKSV
jgi:hypothetical protein